MLIGMLIAILLTKAYSILNSYTRSLHEIILTLKTYNPVILAYDFASALALSKSECLWCESGDPSKLLIKMDSRFRGNDGG